MGLSELLMNQPELNEDGTEYLHDGKSLTRVTQIVNKVLPPYLAPWAEGVGHKAALEVYKRDGQLPGTAEELKKKAIEYGLTCEDEKQAGGDRGSALHLAIEAMVRTGEPTVDLTEFENPEHRLYAQSFAEWMLDYRPEFHEAEVRIVHPDLGYAGTFDGLATMRARPKGARGPDMTGKKLLLDYKTNVNRKVYVTHYAQLCAYETGLEYWDVDFDGSAVVAIGPKRDKGASYRFAPNFWETSAWLSLLEMYRVLERQATRNPLGRKKNA
jgi:hypothetical protein